MCTSPNSTGCCQEPVRRRRTIAPSVNASAPWSRARSAQRASTPALSRRRASRGQGWTLHPQLHQEVMERPAAGEQTTCRIPEVLFCARLMHSQILVNSADAVHPAQLAELLAE